MCTLARAFWFTSVARCICYHCWMSETLVTDINRKLTGRSVHSNDDRPVDTSRQLVLCTKIQAIGLADSHHYHSLTSHNDDVYTTAAEDIST